MNHKPQTRTRSHELWTSGPGTLDGAVYAKPGRKVDYFLRWFGSDTVSISIEPFSRHDWTELDNFNKTNIPCYRSLVLQLFSDQDILGLITSGGCSGLLIAKKKLIADDCLVLEPFPLPGKWLVLTMVFCSSFDIDFWEWLGNVEENLRVTSFGVAHLCSHQRFSLVRVFFSYAFLVVSHSVR